MKEKCTSDSFKIIKINSISDNDHGDVTSTARWQLSKWNVVISRLLGSIGILSWLWHCKAGMHALAIHSLSATIASTEGLVTKIKRWSMCMEWPCGVLNKLCKDACPCNHKWNIPASNQLCLTAISLMVEYESCHEKTANFRSFCPMFQNIF